MELNPTELIPCHLVINIKFSDCQELDLVLGLGSTQK